MGDGVSKPGTSDPDTLQEQIDILLHDQKKHKAGWFLLQNMYRGSACHGERFGVGPSDF